MRKLYTMFVTLSLLLLGLWPSSELQGQTKRGITPEDYFAFRFAGDPRLSPDGKAVAFVVKTIKKKKKRRNFWVCFVPADGTAAPRRLTAEGFTCNSPRWSPNGKTLAVLSTRNPDPAAGESAKAQ